MWATHTSTTRVNSRTTTWRALARRCRRLNRKTIYAYVQRGLIPHVRIESNVRFSEHQVMRWLEERSFQPRLVRGKGAKRQ